VLQPLPSRSHVPCDAKSCEQARGSGSRRRNEVSGRRQ